MNTRSTRSRNFNAAQERIQKKCDKCAWQCPTPVVSSSSPNLNPNPGQPNKNPLNPLLKSFLRTYLCGRGDDTTLQLSFNGKTVAKSKSKGKSESSKD